MGGLFQHTLIYGHSEFNGQDCEEEIGKCVYMPHLHELCFSVVSVHGQLCGRYEIQCYRNLVSFDRSCWLNI